MGLLDIVRVRSWTREKRERNVNTAENRGRRDLAWPAQDVLPCLRINAFPSILCFVLHSSRYLIPDFIALETEPWNRLSKTLRTGLSSDTRSKSRVHALFTHLTSCFRLPDGERILVGVAGYAEETR